MQRRPGGLVVLALAATTVLGLAGCGIDETAPQAGMPVARHLSPVTIAFAGDVHFAGVLENRLKSPATAMGPLTAELAAADLSVVNLETAVTTRGTPQAKEFTFRAPPVAFQALKGAGIDLVTMANNHALDYGPAGVSDTLTAAQQAGMPVVGLGADDQQAFAPYVAEVKGTRIAVLGATAVLDDSLVSSWTAAPGHPGVATALDGQNAALVEAVKAARNQADTVVVELHYGKDLTTCPTSVQRKLAADLVEAGADIIVGQHAHVLLGGGYLGSAYVHYGMGNYEFYTSAGGAAAETGVLTLTTTGRTVSDATWKPGRIENGLPTPLTGEAAKKATATWESLRGCAGLSAQPTTSPGSG